MKKFIALVILLIPIVTNAQTCPAAKTVFIQQGNDYIPTPPPGWQFSNWASHLDSSDVRFVLAAYGADLHPPTQKDNHVRCYYGNPDLAPEHGISIETIAVIPETAISSHKEWDQNQHYYMCGQTNDVTKCNFD